MINGNSVIVEFGKELIYGTAVEPENRIEVSSESFIPTYNKTSEGLLTGGLADGLTETMSVKAGGNFSVLAKPESVGHVLKGVFGNETVEEKDGKYLHTFTPVGNGENDYLPSYTFTIDRKASVKAYTGITFDSVAFSAAAEDRLKIEVTTVGRAEEPGTIDNDLVAEDAYSFKFHQAKVHLDNTDLEVNDIKFNYGNGLDSSVQTTTTGLYFKQPRPGKRTASAEVEVMFSTYSEAIREGKFKTDAIVSVSIDFTDKDGNVITFEIPKAQITAMDPATATAEDTLKQPITITGVNSPVFAKATLLNDVANEY